MKILITGASGLLGKSLLETKPDDTILTQTWFKNLYGVSLGQDIWLKLDIRNKADVYDVFQQIQPDVVIHCAAIGSVDYAEDHRDEVSGVNFLGTKNVIEAARDYAARIVYISTNAVFSGNLPPYDEKSSLEPINAYGAIKTQAERYVRDVALEWTIIRPFLLYGWPYQGGRNNWANAIIEKFRGGLGSFKMVNDHYWQPTYAPDCAEAIWKLLFQKGNHIFNVASQERATLYEFGLKVCDVFGLEKNLIQPVGSEYFPSIAKRPVDTTYDLKKLKGMGIVLSDIKTGLEKMREAEETNEL